MCEFLLFENRFFPSRFQAVKPKSCFCFRFLGFSLPVCPAAFKDKRCVTAVTASTTPGPPPIGLGASQAPEEPKLVPHVLPVGCGVHRK